MTWGTVGQIFQFFIPTLALAVAATSLWRSRTIAQRLRNIEQTGSATFAATQSRSEPASRDLPVLTASEVKERIVEYAGNPENCDRDGYVRTKDLEPAIHGSELHRALAELAKQDRIEVSQSRRAYRLANDVK